MHFKTEMKVQRGKDKCMLGEGTLVQWIKLASILTVSGPNQLPAQASRKAAEDGPGVGASALTQDRRC